MSMQNAQASDDDGFGEDDDDPDVLAQQVEEERLAGVERVLRAQAQVQHQEIIYRQIKMRVGEDPDEDHRSAEGSTYTHESSELPFEASALLESTATGERYEHSRIVAEELLRRKIRYAKFQKNHQRRLDQDEAYRNQINQKRRDAEAQAQRRQHEMFQIQREKSFLAQQKRGEQQKMLKEIQRDEDHKFEVLQEKHHHFLAAAHGTAPRPPTGPRAGKAPPPPPGAPRPGSSPIERSKSDPIVNERIYQDMCKSRALYNEEFERWEKRAQENERRTEAHWRKMLSGSSRNKDDEPKVSKGRNLFKRAIKEVKNIKTFVAKAPFDKCELRKVESLPSPSGTIGSGPTSIEDDAFDVTTYPFMSSSPHSTSSLPEIRSPNATYQERRQRCQSHLLNYEEANLEKKAHDQKRNEEARQRQKAHKDARSLEASGLLQIWSQRCDAAEQHRKMASIFNEDAVLQKHEDWSSKWNEEQMRKEEERLKFAETSSDWRSGIKEQSDKLNSTTESAFRAKMAEKDDRTAAHMQQRREKDDRRLDKLGEHVEIAREKARQKKKANEDFQKRTAKEIQMKENRSHKVMHTASKPSSTKEALERHRTRKEEELKKVPIQPKELMLPPELALAPNLLLSPKLKKGAKPAAAKRDTAEPAAASADESLQVERSATESLLNEALLPDGVPGNRGSSTGFENLMLNEDSLMSQEESLRLFRKSLNLDDDSDAEFDFEVGEVSGEQKFIQKLKDWSTEELRIIRKKERDRPVAF